MNNNTAPIQVVNIIKRCAIEKEKINSMKISIFIEVALAIGILSYWMMRNISAVLITTLVMVICLYMVVLRYDKVERAVMPFIDAVDSSTPTKLSDEIKSISDADRFKESTQNFVILSQILQCISTLSVIVLLVFAIVAITLLFEHF